MENENELIVNKLAHIRDNAFDESDFVSDEGHDLVPNYVASPYEVLCGVEHKLNKQKKEIERYKKALRFYANHENYELSAEAEKADLVEFINVLDMDGGDIARRTLEGKR